MRCCFAFRADTRTIDVPYAFQSIDLGFTFLAVPRLVGFAAVFVVALALWLIMGFTDTGRAIRAVAKEKLGAELAGIDVAHVYAVTFGLGTACVAIAACLLMPTYYVNPSAGNAFVLVAFTIVVLGGMGSVPGALIGGLVIGVVESLSSLFLGELLGQIGIFLIFIAVLLVRPQRSVRSEAHEGVRSHRGRDCAAGGGAADRAFQCHAQLPGGRADDRAGRPGLEYPRRLWRAVFLRPRGLLRHRRLCHRHPAGALRRQCLAGLRPRHCRRRRASAR